MQILISFKLVFFLKVRTITVSFSLIIMVLDFIFFFFNENYQSSMSCKRWIRRATPWIMFYNLQYHIEDGQDDGHTMDMVGGQKLINVYLLYNPLTMLYNNQT